MPTLIIEDGTMPDGANSYISLAEATAYLTSRGVWEASEDVSVIAQRETAIIRASDYMNTLVWKGALLRWERIMSWPRKGVIVAVDAEEKPVFMPDNVVPKQVVTANAELAGLITSGENPLEKVERGGKIVSESHSKTEGGVDVIGGDSTSDSYSYSESAPVETYFPMVAGLLSSFLEVVPGKKRSAQVVSVERG